MERPAPATPSSLRFWLPFGVLLASLLLATGFWRRARAAHRAELKAAFEVHSQNALAQLSTRLRHYERALLATRGLFQARGAVSRTEFAAFVASLDLEPGIQGIGFAVLVPAADKARHLTQIRSQGFPDYQIRPAGNRDLYSSIIYLEPFAGPNLRAFGYDMFSEPVRQQAMRRAAETNHLSMSGKVQLVQDTEPQAGFLLYVPVYADGSALATPEDRRRNLVGWVYGLFRMNDFMQGALGAVDQQSVDIEIFDGPASPANLLYHRDPTLNALPSSDLQASHPHTFGGESWTIATHALPALFARHADPSTTVLALGGLVSLLLGLVTFAVVSHLAQVKRESENKYRALFDSAGDAIFIHNAQGGMLAVNPLACERLGYTQAELLALPIGAVDSPEQSQHVPERIAKLMEEGHLTFETEHQRKDGSSVPTEANIRRVTWEGQPAIMSICRDITERKRSEQALRISEERYNTAFQFVPVALGVTAVEDGRFLVVNKAFEDLSGYSQAELVGKCSEDIRLWVDPEDRGEILDVVRANRSIQGYEAQVRRRDGSLRWVSYSGQAVDMNGVHCLLSSAVDITERKTADESLQRSRELYAALFNLLPATGVVLTDDAGQIIEANLAAVEILGLSRSQTLARTYDAPDWTIIRPDGTPMPVHEYASVRALRERRQVNDVEMGIRRPDGDLRWVLTSATPIPMAGLGVSITFSDITERKQAEVEKATLIDQLQQEQVFSKSIIDTLPGVFFLYTYPECKLVLCNTRHESIMGYGPGEMLGHHVTDWHSPADKAAVMGVIHAVMEAGHGSLEASPLTRDGRSIPLFLSAVPFESQGKRYFLGTGADITERKQAEKEKLILQAQLQQSQKMESLGTLAGGVAHDMNNVLGAILGMASSHIGAQTVGSPIYQALDTICKATERGGKMVKSLLSFARQSPAENNKLDMNAILKEQVSLLERTTLAKVRLEMDLAADLRPILGDASALTHAFMNLCVNAVDAMPENGTLTLHTCNVDNDWIEIVVEDTGTGMPKDVLEKALDPFFTTKEIGKGTGLGLSMVFSTVKAHRGQMAIESEPGQGTRVRLRFPACENETQAQGAEPAVAEATPTPPGTLKVLLVDDDELVQSSLQMILEVLGHTVNPAQSGEEALAKLQAGFEPDLVILDMNMPGLGGAGTLPRLRGLRPKVPVLLATGRVDQAALTLASAHPGVHLLSKPFGLRELQKQLENIGLG